MNIESIKSLFTLFSGEEIPESVPLIELAIAETEKLLVPGCDKNDIRLDFLCAAKANYRLQQIRASRMRGVSAFTGKTIKPAGGNLVYAERLLRDYMQLCEDLIISENFVFRSFSGEG